MADELDVSLLSPSPDSSAPRIRLSEVGYTGIRTVAGKINEEANTKLRFPQFIKEVDEMLNDATIATGISFTRQMISRVKWKVNAPVGATPEQEEKAKFIESCMKDMEHSWLNFIIEASNYIPYGFSVHEKVWRRRLKSNGSKYDDGLVGWRKLPVRSQNTIEEWEFSDDGRSILGCKQSTKNLVTGYKVASLPSPDIYIPRNKFMLFTADSRLGNPLGHSPLAAVWKHWRYRQELEKIQSIAAARDLEGIPLIECPSSFMSDDAPADKKAVYQMLKSIAANFHRNAQSGLVMPSDVDYETKQKLFSVKLLTTENGGGGKGHIEDTIKRINGQILLALGADVLALGVEKVGSFSLAGAKTSLTALMLEYRLREIQDVLNNDLVKQTFEMNGWTDTELPQIVFEEFDEADLDEKSKYLQRVASQGLIVRDIHQVNAIRKDQKLPLFPSDTEVDDLEFSKDASRSGDGMEKGTGNGTSDDTAEEDNSISNTENA